MIGYGLDGGSIVFSSNELYFSAKLSLIPVSCGFSGVTSQPTHKVEGNVYDYQGNPIDRKICVFSKTNDALLGSGTSSPTTGFYSISFASTDQVYVVCFPRVDEDINAKIYDRVVPVSI